MKHKSSVLYQRRYLPTSIGRWSSPTGRGGVSLAAIEQPVLRGTDCSADTGAILPVGIRAGSGRLWIDRRVGDGSGDHPSGSFPTESIQRLQIVHEWDRIDTTVFPATADQVRVLGVSEFRRQCFPTNLIGDHANGAPDSPSR